MESKGKDSSSLYVGLMSGTSLDGIDAVLVEIGEEGGERVKLVKSHLVPFEEEMVRRVRAISLGEYGAGSRDPVDELGSLHAGLGRLFAKAVNELLRGADKGSVRAIGSHGVTVRHRPGGVRGRET